MPKRIIAIGLLFVICGLLALYQVIEDLTRNHLNLNLAVLMLPVGIGLLCGKKWSQWCARLWIILGYCLAALLVVLALIRPENARASVFTFQVSGTDAVPYVFLLAILLTVGLVILHRLLYSERSNAYFNRR